MVAHLSPKPSRRRAIALCKSLIWLRETSSLSVVIESSGRMVENRHLSTMPLNIKNLEVETLAGEVAALAHETKTEAIRRALLERRARLEARAGKPGRRKSLREYLEQNV